MRQNKNKCSLRSAPWKSRKGLRQKRKEDLAQSALRRLAVIGYRKLAASRAFRARPCSACCARNSKFSVGANNSADPSRDEVRTAFARHLFVTGDYADVDSNLFA
jgi:hypothetical protein